MGHFPTNYQRLWHGPKMSQTQPFFAPPKLAEPIKKSPGIGSGIPKNRKKHREMSRKLCRNHRGKHLYYINIYIYIYYININTIYIYMCVCVCIIFYIKKSNEKTSEKLACPGLKKMFIIGIQMVSIKICQAFRESFQRHLWPTILQPPATAWQMRKESRSHYK